MSYCRFSSDDWKCDLYCYGDIGGGFTVHVAANRFVVDPPETPPWPQKAEGPEFEAWVKGHIEQSEAIRERPRKPIELPHAGESFYRLDIDTFLDTVKMLKSIGYRVPDWVIEEIEQEISEETDHG